ncbi:lysine biosynthesis protein LysW [Oceanithermus sp.]
MTATCPECGATLTLESPELGELLICDDCGAELEVVSVEPLKVELAPEEAEDWGE